MKPAAVIFDLDGTLIDNNSYHIEAWKVFYKRLNREWSDEEYKTQFNGKINRDIFNYIFQRELMPEEINAFTNEKEAMYRYLYAPYISPINGLIELLNEIQSASIKMAIATSGLPENVRFMFDNIAIEKYFEKVVDATYVTRGKPNPEIFLKAASFLYADPAQCIAFEDSVAGVQSAKSAGMKVVALTTTHTAEDLHLADVIIKDYTGVNPGSLLQLMNA